MAKEEPTAAWILTLIGGIIGLLVYLYYMVIALAAAASVPFMFGYAGPVIAGVCGWFVISHILILIGAFKIKSGEPGAVRTWGIIVLVFSIIGGGNLLSLIGGILALVWKPSKREVPPPPPV